jgi:hypothetical protein
VRIELVVAQPSGNEIQAEPVDHRDPGREVDEPAVDRTQMSAAARGRIDLTEPAPV